jgi:hypothetical protein
MKLAVLLGLLTAVAHATCGIAVWTPERIILGSDSRETYLTPFHGTSSSTQCKLRQIGPDYVIVSGVMQHERSGFNVFDILGESIMRTNSVTDAAEDAAGEIARRYAEVLRVSRGSSSREFLSELEINAPVFAIAGFTDGRPYLAHYEYDLVDGQWKWRKWVYGASRSDGSMDYAYLCDPAGIAMFQRQHPQWRTEDPLKVIAGMIRAAARVDTVEVGGPMALLVIDSSGSRWENPGVCW